ncbi:hypothetical protein [Kribbella sp. NPDC023855]|uniref:hypothetical protein n=1 Tax=Kribbella sp. NPDC023855 TaxID=3154698 RepID=UPI003407CC5C
MNKILRAGSASLLLVMTNTTAAAALSSDQGTQEVSNLATPPSEVTMVDLGCVSQDFGSAQMVFKTCITQFSEDGLERFTLNARVLNVTTSKSFYLEDIKLESTQGQPLETCPMSWLSPTTWANCTLNPPGGQTIAKVNWIDHGQPAKVSITINPPF